MLSSLAIALFVSASAASDSLPVFVPRQLQQENAGCSAFASVITSCASKTPDFTDLAFTQQASCLCYQGTTFAPSVYDGYISTCLAFYETASPSFYSSLGGTKVPTAPCAQVTAAATATSTASGSNTVVISSGGQTGTITAGPTATVDANAAKCTSWDQLEQACSQRTPGFGALSLTSQLSCLCYAGTSYAPQIYDGYWQGCLSFFQTANSTLYNSFQSIGVQTAPCSRAGDIKGSSSSSSASTTAMATSSPSVLTTQGSATATQHGSASTPLSKSWVEVFAAFLVAVFV